MMNDKKQDLAVDQEADLNTQTIEVEAGDQELVFDVTRNDYNGYINAATPTSTVAPAHNFCIATIRDDNKAAMKELFKTIPGAEVHMAHAVLEQYMPDIEFVAKKRKA